VYRTELDGGPDAKLKEQFQWQEREKAPSVRLWE
jgi:hypothetical protein